MRWVKCYKGEDRIYIDEAIFFGKGAFETIAIYEKPIMLKEHIFRLNNSLKKLQINKEIDFRNISEIINEDNITNKALKITITPRNNILSLRDITYKKDDYENGFSLGISKVIRNSTAFLTTIKSICYEENLIIKEQGVKNGWNEMIFINERGVISEGTCSNLFFVKDKKIYTPSLSCGLLDGIMRKWVIENFDVNEGEFLLDDLLYASEIFITNSLMGVMWIKKIDSVNFNKGEVTTNVMEKYNVFLMENGG